MWYRRALVLNIIVQSGIIITGAIVRVTGSGLGCPTWPDCVEGSLAPTADQAEDWHKWVEFGNRLLTFVVGLVALIVIIGALKHFKQAKRRLLAAAPLLGTLAQALLGGVTVLTGLHPLTVMAHFLLSIIIVGLSVRLWFTSLERIKTDDALLKSFSYVLPFVTFLLIAAGTLVTGSGPHSGDADVTHRLPFDLKTVAWFHADILWLFLGLLITLWIVVKASHHTLTPKAKEWLTTVSVLTLIQGLIGYVQFFTSLPELLVIFHVIGAVLVWNFVLRLSYELRYKTNKSNS
jgi:cytochrome c oxidase assembly protein subunit 15